MWNALEIIDFIYQKVCAKRGRLKKTSYWGHKRVPSSQTPGLFAVGLCSCEALKNKRTKLLCADACVSYPRWGLREASGGRWRRPRWRPQASPAKPWHSGSNQRPSRSPLKNTHNGKCKVCRLKPGISYAYTFKFEQPVTDNQVSAGQMIDLHFDIFRNIFNSQEWLLKRWKLAGKFICDTLYRK